MRTFNRSFLLVAAVLATVPLHAAEPAPSGGQSEFTFPRYIPDDCDNLFVVGDPMPPLRRMLSSDSFRHFASESKFARLISRKGDDLSQILTKLEANTQYVPAEIAVGIPSSTYDEFVTIAKFALALGLCNGATNAGGDAVENELPKLQAILLEAAEALKAPQLTLWIRFRQPQTAESVFGHITKASARLVGQEGFQVSNEVGRVRVKFILGELMPPDTLANFLAMLGVNANADDPNLPKMAAAIAKFEVEAWVELLDDGLRVDIGRRPPEKAAYPVETLGPLLRADDAPVLAFGKWRIAGLKAGISDVEKTWQDWRNTASGKAAKERDDEDMLGTLTQVSYELKRASDSGTFQVTATSSLNGIVREEGFQPIESLAASPLVKFLPRDAELFDVDARYSLADHLAQTLGDFEERVSKQWLKGEVSGRREQAEVAAKTSNFYYKQLAAFRRVVYDDAKKVFVPPYAMLMGSRGKIERFEVRFNDSNGQKNGITVRDAPIVEYAAIGRLADPSRPPTIINEIGRAFFSGFIENVPEAVTASRDLGLGVETFVLQDKAFDRPPHNISITVEGDLQPHYFVIDGWLVASTSARLSKSIIAAWREPGQRYSPPMSAGGELCAFGQYPAETLAKFIEHTFKLVGDVASGKGSVKLTGPAVEHFQTGQELPDIAISFGEAMRLLDRIDWKTFDRGSVRETRYSVTFAESGARK